MVTCLKKGKINVNLNTVYVDIDDVLIFTMKELLTILKEEYPDNRKIQSIEIKDIKNWDFSISVADNKEVFTKDVLHILDTDEFWNNVQLNENFVKIIEKWFGIYNFVFVSKGSKKNLQRKAELLNHFSSNEELCNSVVLYGLEHGDTKASIRMIGGIQIDDNYHFLKDTDADIKILYCTYPETKRETDYNGVRAIEGNLDNLYITEFVDEIDSILDFNYNVQSLSMDNDELLN